MRLLHHQHWKYRAVCQAAGTENWTSTYSLAEAKKRNFVGAEAIYLGWIMAGSVKAMPRLRRTIGCAPSAASVWDKPEHKTESVRKKSAIPANIPLFTLQGNFNVKKLHGIYRFMMEIMVKQWAKVWPQRKTARRRRTICWI